MMIEYSSNISGGRWWLEDKDWKNLKKAGWKVVWANEEFVYKDGNHKYNKKGFPVTKKVKSPKFGDKDKNGDWRWLGALAKRAFKDFPSLKDAMEEFEKITGQDITDEGCNCCGPPHCFETHGENREYASGEGCIRYLYGLDPPSTRELIERIKGLK